MFESVFAQIAGLRDGKPTIFRMVNRYSDVQGDEIPGWQRCPA